MLLASATASSGVRKVMVDQHRPEYLLAREQRGGLDAADQSRRIEAAARRQFDLAADRSSAPSARPASTSRWMRSSCTGATIAPMSVDLSRGSPTVSVGMRARSLATNFRSTLFGDQQPRARAADLALVEPDRVDDALDRAVEIGVVEDDERRLAAEFERKLLARARRRAADDAADLGRAGEGDLVDVVMPDDGRARRAVAGDDVDDARRQAHLDADFGEGQRRQRGEFGGLQHHRIARSQRGRDLPRQHQQREIPRNDLPADADRPLHVIFHEPIDPAKFASRGDLMRAVRTAIASGLPEWMRT